MASLRGTRHLAPHTGIRLGTARATPSNCGKLLRALGTKPRRKRPGGRWENHPGTVKTPGIGQSAAKLLSGASHGAP